MTETMREPTVPAFWDAVRALMDERGIEDVEDLHRRFLETEWAQRVPVPGRRRGSTPKLPEFRRHVEGTYPILYGEFIAGLFEVFGLDERDPRAVRLVLSYAVGRSLERKADVGPR
jgi:hypothetical protein